MKRNNVKQITIRLTADEYAHVKQLSKDVGIPEKVSEVGVKEEDIQFLAESAC